MTKHDNGPIYQVTISCFIHGVPSPTLLGLTPLMTNHKRCQKERGHRLSLFPKMMLGEKEDSFLFGQQSGNPSIKVWSLSSEKLKGKDLNKKAMTMKQSHSKQHHRLYSRYGGCDERFTHGCLQDGWDEWCMEPNSNQQSLHQETWQSVS